MDLSYTLRGLPTKLRRNANYEKNYIAGRFGAVPYNKIILY